MKGSSCTQIGGFSPPGTVDEWRFNWCTSAVQPVLDYTFHSKQTCKKKSPHSRPLVRLKEIGGLQSHSLCRGPGHPPKGNIFAKCITLLQFGSRMLEKGSFHKVDNLDITVCI